MSLPPGWQADIIKSLGGTHTAAGEHLLGAWQQWEGGGTANDASFNPLNTTRGDYRKINSVGVSAFPDWQTGVAETVGTLKNYPALTEALRSGKVDFTNPALQADFNYWLTGKRTPGMTPYVAKIARSYGHDVPVSETRALTSSVPPPPPVVAAPRSAPRADKRITFMDIALGKKSIMDMFFQRHDPAPAPAPTQAKAPPPSSAGAGRPEWTLMPSDKNGWMNMNYSKWVGVPEKRTGPSKPSGAEILNFVGHVGEVAQTKLTPWGNESHSLTTVNGNRSAHADGRAADIPASGDELIRLGHAALIAAGMNPAEARKLKGGLFNVGHYQVIFNTNEGGNHHDHVHVGLRG